MYNRPTTPAYKLGSDQRRPLGSSEKTPGPGSYAPSNTNTSPKVNKLQMKRKRI